jgi:hypothetical protein
MRLAIAVAGALLLAGCPIPQPLPDYPPGTITPPRILADQIQPNGAAVRLVPADCTPEPEYPLTAQIFDTNTIETIEARWFVNYDSRYFQYYNPVRDDPVPPDPDPGVLTRVVPPTSHGPLVFRPYQHPAAADAPPASGPPYSGAGIVRVVELVVSNGFDPTAAEPPAALPMRTALPGFETQVYRWVFLSVPQSAAAVCP